MHKKHILPVIVFSQFCCTSLWFAGNSVLPELTAVFGFPASAPGHLTSAVQFGFIVGTLVFALLMLADRFPPARVFLGSAVCGAVFNAAAIWEGNTFGSLLLLRFLTGFCLAGIYPVGMKIAADYFAAGLGKSLGWLVGALVLGTAFPHFIRGFSGGLPWKGVLLAVSGLALGGGLLMWLFVPNGPFRKASQRVNPRLFLQIFKDKKLRGATFGYFGHMWELYAFWAFVPLAISAYNATNLTENLDVSQSAFLVIGSGAVSCVLGGYAAKRLGTARTAAGFLTLSGLCCLLSPFFFLQNSSVIYLVFLIFWGMTVVADSPLFSTLVAQNAQPETRGTALTLVNCVGFALTVFSIQLLGNLTEIVDFSCLFLVLSAGAVMGVLSLRKAFFR